MRARITFSLIAVIGILIIATGLRLYKLSEIPPGFFSDEASVGLNSYTILTNGTDEYGTPYPVFFRAFREYKNPIGIYTTVPFVAIFGLNEFAVRFSSVFFGLLSICAIYLLVKQLFEGNSHKEYIALFAALFLAISPWHNHFSRAYLEALMPFVFLMTLALYFFLKAQDNERFLPLSIATFAISTYSYFPARVFVPLFGISLFAAFFPFFWNHKRMTMLSFLILAAILAPIINHHMTSEGWARWNQVSIFSNVPSDESVFRHIAHNYLSHFSLDFLFFKGDADLPNSSGLRHSVRGMGELYLIQLPLICLGFLGLFKRKYRTTLLILTVWLLIYPLADSLTADKYAQATRSIIGVVPFQILSAIGLFFLISCLSRTNKTVYFLGISTIVIMLTFSFVQYTRLYFVEYPQYAWGWNGWQYGARDIVNYFISVEDQYDSLMMAPVFNGPDIFIPFYSQNYEKGCTRCRVRRVDEYTSEFLNSSDDKLKRALFAIPLSDAEKLPSGFSFETKKTVHYTNNSTLIIIGVAKR